MNVSAHAQGLVRMRLYMHMHMHVRTPHRHLSSPLLFWILKKNNQLSYSVLCFSWLACLRKWWRHHRAHRRQRWRDIAKPTCCRLLPHPLPFFHSMSHEVFIIHLYTLIAYASTLTQKHTYTHKYASKRTSSTYAHPHSRSNWLLYAHSRAN